MGPGVYCGRALALDHLQRGAGLEALLQQQTRARGEGTPDRHRDACGPEERIGCVQPVVWIEAQHLGEAPGLQDRRALSVQHHLRIRGRTGGVDQHAVVRRLDLVDAGVEELIGDAVRVREQFAEGLDGAAGRVDRKASDSPELRKLRIQQPPGLRAQDFRMRCQQHIQQTMVQQLRL